MTQREYPPELPAGSTARPGVPSPCVNVCEMDSSSRLCKGCGRTIDEIASWSLLDDSTKRLVLDAIARRRRRSV